MGDPPTTDPSDDAFDFESTPLGDARRPADPATLQHAQTGDREALTALWRQHAPHIVRLFQAQRLTNADEVASQVWTDIGRSIKRFVGDGQAFRRWVLLVASTHARVARPEADTDEARPSAETDRDDATIAGAVATMASLPPDTAEAVMLRHVHGLSIADIAEITGDAPGDVRLLVHNGTKRLRKVLSVVDDEGVVIEPGTEWSLTDRLREQGTPTEFASETRQVDMVVASMDTAGAARAAAAAPQRKRRAGALVAASLLLLAGGVVLSSLEINDDPASGLASVDSVEGPSGEADIRRLPETPNVQPGEDLALATRDGGAEPTDDDAAAVAADDDAPVATSDSDDALATDGDAAAGGGGVSDADGDDNGANNNSGDRNDTRTTAPPAPTPTTPVPVAGPPAPGQVPVTATPTTPPTTGPVNIPIPATTRPTIDTTPPTTPATTQPRTTTPATTRPPVTSPPTTRPPVTSPPTTQPPVTSPPTTRPPVTSPPTTQPPITAPPTTRPPITAPPTTRPPITAPPTTRPPVTSPPTTRPPVTAAPTTQAAVVPDDEDEQ